jgi:hypothetical protein
VIIATTTIIVSVENVLAPWVIPIIGEYVELRMINLLVKELVCPKNKCGMQ